LTVRGRPLTAAVEARWPAGSSSLSLSTNRSRASDRFRDPS